MHQDTTPQNNFPVALRLARTACNVSQEAFGRVSSRTYVLNKIDELASVLGIHPLTLVALCYLNGEDPKSKEALMAKFSDELTRVLGH